MANTDRFAGSHIGPYEIRGKLGEGAMAVVWRGYDPNLEREVAIKEPKFSAADSAERREDLGARFVREGKAAAKLVHGNIVTIYAADIYDGRPAIVMELVEGSTLFDLLDAGALAPDIALSIADQLLDAVTCAHNRGIIHRDIKPDNIFLNREGIVKLADFGIAHVDDGHATHATMDGTVLGAPGYMSPEQAVGAPVDARSDLFSIGVVLYEMLTGNNPFMMGGSNNATTILYRTVHEPVPELPESASYGLPADLRPAVLAALEKDPNNRPQSAEAFKAALHGAPLPSPTAQRPQQNVGATTTPRPPAPSRNYAPFIAIGIVGVAAIVALLIFATNGGGGGKVAPNPSGSTNQVAAGVAGASTTPTDGTTTDSGTTTASEASGTKATTGTTSTTSAGPVHIGTTEDGYVSIWEGPIGKEATLKRKTGLKVTDVDAVMPGEGKKINSGIVVGSVEEAEATVDGYTQALSRKQQSAPDAVELVVEGADGSVRRETIRRQQGTQRVFADSNTRYLSEDEVANLSDAERCVAWNEIIAAETGYSFKNSGLASYFNNHCSGWYRSSGGSGGTEDLSAAGRANVSLLKDYTSGWWKNLASN